MKAVNQIFDCACFEPTRLVGLWKLRLRVVDVLNTLKHDQQPLIANMNLKGLDTINERI